MKVWKILLASILALALILAAVACATPEEEDPGKSDPKPKPVPVVDPEGEDDPGEEEEEFEEEDKPGEMQFAVIDSDNCRIVSRTGKFTGTLTIPETATIGGKEYTVTEIAENAFHHSRSVTEIVIPDTVAKIGRGAFKGCETLEKITLPFVGGSATENGYIGHLFGASSLAQNASVVPATLKTVVLSDACTAVAPFAFDNCAALESVTFGTGLASIGAYAFNETALTAVEIPNSVSSVGIGAFACCDLTSIKLPFVGADKTGAIGYIGYLFGASDANKNADFVPETLAKVDLSGSNVCTAIGTGAFKNCEHINEILLPDTVVTIGAEAFTGTPFFDQKPAGVVYVGNVLYTYKGELTSSDIVVNNGTVAIADGAFDGLALTSVTLPDSITNIGFAAFRGSAFTSIELPFLGDNGTAHTNFGYIFGDTVDTNGQNVPATLKYVTLKSSCTAIAANAFSGCTGIESVYVGSGVANIDKTAFRACPALASITIDAGNAAYKNESGLVYNAAYNDLIAVPMARSGAVTLLDITAVDAGAFRDCAALTGVTLPDGLLTIGEDAFNGCTALESINFPASLTTVGYNALAGTAWYEAQANGVIYLANVLYALKGPAASSVTVVDGTVSLTDRAFENATLLRTVVIPDSVVTIGKNVFTGCNGISSLTLPFIGASATDTETTMIAYLFGAMTPRAAATAVPASLQSVTLSSTCTRIGANAFTGCKNVSTINFDEDAVTYIAGRSLDDTAWLKNLLQPGVVYVGHIAYTFRPGEKTYADLQAEATEAGETLGLTIYDVVIRDGTLGIADYAFNESGVHTIWMPDSVLSIGDNAFSYSRNLVSIAMSSGATYIGKYAFSECSSLSNIYVPTGVSQIAEGCFTYCSNLREMVIGAGVTAFGPDALTGCPLMNLYYEGDAAGKRTIQQNSDPTNDRAFESLLTFQANYARYKKAEKPVEEEPVD